MIKFTQHRVAAKSYVPNKLPQGERWFQSPPECSLGGLKCAFPQSDGGGGAGPLPASKVAGSILCGCQRVLYQWAPLSPRSDMSPLMGRHNMNQNPRKVTSLYTRYTLICIDL